MFEKIIKQYITYTLIVLLILYHAIQIITPEIYNKNILSIIDIVELVLLIGFALISFQIPLIHKIILGKNFIGGEYNGKSYYIDDNGKIIGNGRIMKFSINQTLTKLNIVGFSKAINNNEKIVDTVWQGFYYKKDGNNYYFALEVDYGSIETGILKLIFNENNNECVGYYYSGDSHSKNQKIIFNKV